MTQTNAIADMFAARIEREQDKACSATLAKLKKNYAYFQQAAIAEILEENAIDAAFINKQQNATNFFDMKAIDRTTVYLQVALKSLSLDKFTDNARTVFMTACKLFDADKHMTLNDACASCTSAKDKRFAIAKDHEQYISRREQMLEAAKRQAEMSLKSLQALNMIILVSKHTYKLNADSTIVQKLRSVIETK
ncbi:hypothetical protein [Phyllobacterium myrsinacearum]|uniref:Polysaccharide pyruvyl transferase WcaK-like protein n=1 Tax=Phyllobacterium myrsinacearum TaxID=28101 RepID=A0A839EYZ5_9HYPH|nr:hypothetical protein [Phyllobacterium myrsinacearum]MBA8881690.1 polysaccharide pyruvyl transferase WcaK-like protein [Phyllobacterium myrsinacearum]